MAEMRERAVAMRPPMPQLQRKMLSRMQPPAQQDGSQVWEASGLGGSTARDVWGGIPLFPWEKVGALPDDKRVVNAKNPWSE